MKGGTKPKTEVWQGVHLYENKSMGMRWSLNNKKALEGF